MPRSLVPCLNSLVPGLHEVEFIGQCQDVLHRMVQHGPELERVPRAALLQAPRRERQRSAAQWASLLQPQRAAEQRQ